MFNFKSDLGVEENYLWPGNTNWRLNTVDLLIKVASLFCKKKVNDILSIKINWSKLVSARRLTVLSLPLQLGLPVKYLEVLQQSAKLW